MPKLVGMAQVNEKHSIRLSFSKISLLLLLVIDQESGELVDLTGNICTVLCM